MKNILIALLSWISLLGATFRSAQAIEISFFNLNSDQKQDLLQFKRVVLPVRIEDNLAKGEVFQYIPSIDPVQLAALFFDYNNQYLFLRGMTSTIVQEWNGISENHEWEGVRALVSQHINPLGFLLPNAPLQNFQNCFFDATAFRYNLVEDLVYNSDDESYLIQWSEPMQDRKKHSNSNETGKIRFEPFNNGTLISYSNATKPPLFGLKPKGPDLNIITDGIEDYICNTAEAYYRDTIKFFMIQFYKEKNKDNGISIQEKIDHMLGALNNDKAF